jgi:hypothetical protein
MFATPIVQNANFHNEAMAMHMRTRRVGCDLGSWEPMFETPIVRNAHFHHEAMKMHMRTRTVGCDLGRKGAALGGHS